jgi:hypothetical protein
MDLRRMRNACRVLLSTLLCFAGTMFSPVFGGGHHQKTFVVPVQTVAVQAAPIQAAAPVQFVQAAAPLRFRRVQAAAPVQFVQAQAAAPVQFVQAQAAAPVVPTATSPAPVAAAPKSSGEAQSYLINGLLYKPVSGAAAASPTAAAAPTDALSEDDRKSILKDLASFVTSYKALTSDSSSIRAAIRSKASDLYAEKNPGKDATSAEGAKAIDSIVEDALGNSPASADKKDDQAQASATQTQQVLVPAAAPMQLFLPVKVKHHGHFLFK